MLIKSFVSYGKYNQREIYDLKEMCIFLFAVKLLMKCRVCELRMETISVLASRIRKLVKTQFFFTNTACVHTYPAYFPTVSGNF